MLFKGGYMGKILRIDLSKKKYIVQSVNEDHLKKLLGGRGLAAKMYYDEIGPGVKPFDDANKLFFITGPLTGVNLPSTTKFQLSTRSPETGMYLCSNCGGDFGPAIKKCGFDGMVIEGKASEPQTKTKSAFEREPLKLWLLCQFDQVMDQTFQGVPR